MRIGSIRYYRFLDAPEVTYSLHVEPDLNLHGHVRVRWSARPGEYAIVWAETLDQAEEKAVEAMYHHLTQRYVAMRICFGV